MSECSKKNRQYMFAKDFLGPFYAEFCRRLWLFQETQAKNETCALFCARGGIRLRFLYEKFLEKMDLDAPIINHDFMISRLLAAKVSFYKSKDLVLKSLEREFRHANIIQVASSFLPPNLENLNDVLSSINDEPANSQTINSLFFGEGEVSKIINEHLLEQTSLFDDYIQGIMENHQKAMLVDSGLFGSTQMLLSSAYHEIEWSGYYVARSNYRNDSAPHFNSATGILLESDNYSPTNPVTSLLKYWHLIEMPLEADVESVTHLILGEDDEVISNLQVAGWKKQAFSDECPFFRGILAYFEDLNSSEFVMCNANYERAISKIADKIHAPSKRDLVSMVVGERSHDFGRKGTSHVLDYSLSLRKVCLSRNVKNLFRNSLWLEGQLVYVFGFAGFIACKTFYVCKKITYYARSLKCSLKI